jgi:glycosyltransferase involved in cell wall biosynthesis
VNIAHVQGIFSPEHGGPAQSLTNYCQKQSASGHRVTAWVLEGFPHTSAAIRLPPPVEMHVCRVDSPARLGGSSAMRRQLREAESPDIYHLHGAWLRAMYYGADEARRRQRPYVLELMGMYEPWGLRQKWLQKRVARWWFQDRILRDAACLHVNSNQEAEYVRKLGFESPVAVIPVGVDLKIIEMLKAETLKLENDSTLPQELQGHPFILYLSRLHPKKGLDLLIRAWSKVQSGKGSAPGATPSALRASDWRLVIAGSGAQPYVDECRHLATQLGIARECLWLGHVDELQKSWLFANTSCYVLPTSSENFGNTVAEALAHGTPVITTVHTPWADLKKHGCGWVVGNTEEELIPALQEAINMDNVTRGFMGEAGHKLVRDSYSLESVLNSIDAVYKWLSGGGPKPECVQLEG